MSEVRFGPKERALFEAVRKKNNQTIREEYEKISGAKPSVVNLPHIEKTGAARRENEAIAAWLKAAELTGNKDALSEEEALRHVILDNLEKDNCAMANADDEGTRQVDAACVRERTESLEKSGAEKYLEVHYPYDPKYIAELKNRARFFLDEAREFLNSHKQ